MRLSNSERLCEAELDVRCIFSVLQFCSVIIMIIIIASPSCYTHTHTFASVRALHHHHRKRVLFITLAFVSQFTWHSVLQALSLLSFFFLYLSNVQIQPDTTKAMAAYLFGFSFICANGTKRCFSFLYMHKTAEWCCHCSSKRESGWHTLHLTTAFIPNKLTQCADKV